MNATIMKKINKDLTYISLDIQGLMSNYDRELKKAQERIKELAKVADKFLAAQLYLDDFMTNAPDPEYYDKEQEREYKRLCKAKWAAHDKLKAMAWRILGK